MKHMLKISAVYRSGKAEIPIHYTIWADVEQALLNYDFACETIWPVTNSCFFLFLTIKLEINIIRQSSKWPHFSRSQWKMKINTNFAISTFARVKKMGSEKGILHLFQELCRSWIKNSTTWKTRWPAQRKRR